MAHYVGLDVSVRHTSICIVDEAGKIVREARVASEPQAIIPILTARQISCCRVGLEAGPLSTVPGVGPVVAFTFQATVDIPRRFVNSKAVGAHFGLTPRAFSSGETDYTGRISRCGDALMRAMLYEAAHTLLTHTQRWSSLKAWGIRVAQRRGLPKATVAVARKLAVILHRMWMDNSEFRWSARPAIA